MHTSGPLGIILIVDDDANIAELLKFNLGAEGFGVMIIDQAKDVDPQAIVNVRMVIVDAMAQPYTGIQLTKAIKENPLSAHIPVIICSTREGEDAVIDAFDAGAEDYIAKPFSLREMIARIKAILRRHPRRAQVAPMQPAEPTTLEIKHDKVNLKVDIENQRVIEDGMVVPLTRTEYAILLFLLKNQNSFFSRNDICSEVWKDEAAVNVRIVDTNISRLRKKLGESSRYIINRYGLGYAFVDKLV